MRRPAPIPRADNPSPSLSVGFLCHLIELFYRHTSLPLREVVPASYFFPELIAGHLHRSLVLAMCSYSVRFSAHCADQAAFISGLQIDEYLAKAAQKSLDLHELGDQQRHLLQVRTMCILIEYDASQCRGRSAWIYIGKRNQKPTIRTNLGGTDLLNTATGKALLQTCREDKSISREEAETIASSEFFLAMTQHTHSLGQPSLQRDLPIDGLYKDGPSSSNKVPRDLLTQTMLLVRAQQLCSEPLSKQTPRPWFAGSKFGVLQGELEEHILRHPGLPSTMPTGTGSDKDVESWMSLLLSHCCRIVLNKPFLPIPVNQTSNEGEKSDGRGHCLSFQGAPSLFLMERARRCEASAATICLAAQHIIGGGNFFSVSLPI